MIDKGRALCGIREKNNYLEEKYKKKVITFQFITMGLSDLLKL